MKFTELEAGGFAVAEDWWVESDDICSAKRLVLKDGTAEMFGNRLTLRKGFKCDGGSFLAHDDYVSRAGYYAHDARYRLSRQGNFGDEWGKERIKSDRLMYDIHRDKGMTWLRARNIWFWVRVGASDHARPQPDKESIVRVAG
jgi:hypothetical protein